MSQVIADPEEIQQFAQYMLSKAASIREEQSAAQAEFSRLAELWRDSKYEEFAAVMEELMGELRQFVDQCETYAHYLQRKAEILYRYHERGYRR